MHRIDHPTADNNLFTEGNPTTGLPATVVTDDWLNSVQEELANFLEASGIVLNKTNLEQLGEAMARKSPQNLLFAAGLYIPGMPVNYSWTAGQDLNLGAWRVISSNTNVQTLEIIMGVGGAMWLRGTASAGSKIQILALDAAQSSYIPGEQGLGNPGGYNVGPVWKNVYYTDSYDIANAPAGISVTAKFGDRPSQGTPKFLNAPTIAGGQNAKAVRVISANTGDTTQGGLVSGGYVFEFPTAGNFEFCIYNLQQIAGWHEKPPVAAFDFFTSKAQVMKYWEQFTGYYIINQTARRDGPVTAGALYDLAVNYSQKNAVPSSVTVEILEQKYWSGYQNGWVNADSNHTLTFSANSSVFAESSAVLNFFDGPEGPGEVEAEVIWRVKLKITVKV